MKQLALLILIVFFVSCKQSGKPQTQDPVTKETPDPATDSAQIRKVIMGFYNWYAANYRQFDAYHLYTGIKTKEGPPFRISWEEVEKYQRFIKTSVPQLGEEFISNQRIFFKQCDSAFKVDMNDDLPYGFDYDWYTNSQEDPQYLLDAITKGVNWWNIEVKGNNGIVEINGYPDQKGKQDPTTFISLAMKKENNKWTIAGIGKNQ